MIYPDVDPAKWAQKYKLKPDTWKCVKCHEIILRDRPVLMADMAGFETQPHPCGDGYNSVILKPRTPEAKEFWGRVADAVANIKDEP